MLALLTEEKAEGITMITIYYRVQWLIDKGEVNSAGAWARQLATVAFNKVPRLRG